MSDTVLIAIIGAVVSMAIPLATLYVSVLNGRKADAASKALAHNTDLTYTATAAANNTAKKADIIIEKAAEIHTLTNGNLHIVTKDLGVAYEEIKGLKVLVSELVKGRDEAAKVAEAAAAAHTPAVIQQNGVSNPDRS